MPSPEEVRTVALVGSQGAGKTALAEAMLQVAGAVEISTNAHEPVRTFDTEPEEIEHKATLSIGSATFPWKGHRIFLLDTPGFDVFLHETRRALRVADAAIFVLEASDHFKPQFGPLWRMLDDLELPRLVVLSKLDQERASAEAALGALAGGQTQTPLLLHWPIGREGGLRGLVDLVRREAWGIEGNGGGREGTLPLSADLAAEIEGPLRKTLEGIAESDDRLVEKYLEGSPLPPHEIEPALRRAVLARKILAVAVASVPKGIGVGRLLDLVVGILPSPGERGPVRGRLPEAGGAEALREPKADAPFSALVFKTTVDPFAGKLSYLRVYSGTLDGEGAVLNTTRATREKIAHPHWVLGNRMVPPASIGAGTILAVAKLKETLTGDTLSEEKAPVIFDFPPEPDPLVAFALHPKSKADEDRLSTGMHRLCEEDPALKFGREEQTKDLLVSGMGQAHVDVLLARLRRKYAVAVEVRLPKVPYRETTRAKAQAEGKYVKQSGGHGQYGVCLLEIEPLSRGQGFEFVDKIFGGAIPKNFIPAVEKGVREALQHGVVAGYPVQDVRITLLDGKHHVVDSSDLAFKIAASMAFKKAMEGARPVLLEPVLGLEITIPEGVVGEILGDLNARRGRILGVDPEGRLQRVRALVPQPEALLYASDLRSLTQGRGTFRVRFDHYDEVPAHLAEKVVAQAALERGHAAEGAETP